MNRALRVILFVACAAVLAAQPPQSQPAGLEATWDIAAVLQQVSAYATRIQNALDKMDANVWTQQGASETYAVQLQSSREQAKALADGAKVLAQNPEKLAAGLEVLFRMQTLDLMLRSLGEAIQKYQSPTDAQTLAGQAAANGGNQQRFQTYLVNLAAQREQELAVMDKEAQRCRGALTQNPPRPPGRKK